MTLSLRTDTSRPGGGFALLEGSSVAGLMAIIIENVSSGQFLGENGKWGRVAFAFPVEAGPAGSLLLGPHIVDLVPTDLLVELRSEDGAGLGRLFWADVIPSRNPGSITSAQVLAERRRRAEEQAAREQAAQEQAAREQAAREQALEMQAAEARAAEQRSAEDAEARERAAQSRADQLRADQLRADQEHAAKLAAAEAAIKSAADEAERRRVAEQAKAEADRAAAVFAARQIRPDPVRRRARWPLVAALLLLPLAAAATAVILKPVLFDGLRHRTTRPDGHDRTHTMPDVTDPGPIVERKRRATPPPDPVPDPDPVPPVGCSIFSARLTDLQNRTDADKVRLGEDALRAGCGSEAFLAFDAADPQTSEATAWNLARFYDPNEHDLVYRRAASVHADYAAAYYRLWRDRSSRQALALAKICAVERSASLARSCDR